jgi:predicted RNase H-like HicB family nuclease
MSEIIFEVSEDIEGGYVATALGVGIHTQGESVDELKAMVREAVDCYYQGEESKPAIIRLHFVRDEVMTA